MDKYEGEKMRIADVAKVTNGRTVVDVFYNVLELSKHVDDESFTIEGYLLRDSEEFPAAGMRQKLLEIEEALRSTTETLERIQVETDPSR